MSNSVAMQLETVFQVDDQQYFFTCKIDCFSPMWLHFISFKQRDIFLIHTHLNHFQRLFKTLYLDLKIIVFLPLLNQMLLFFFLFQPGHCVLDPMCGKATILVEAAREHLKVWSFTHILSWSRLEYTFSLKQYHFDWKLQNTDIANAATFCFQKGSFSHWIVKFCFKCLKC